MTFEDLESWKHARHLAHDIYTVTRNHAISRDFGHAPETPKHRSTEAPNHRTTEPPAFPRVSILLFPLPINTDKYFVHFCLNILNPSAKIEAKS
jgi:hypothetical protein